MPKKALHLEPISIRILSILAGTLLVAFLLLSATWFFGDAIAGTAVSLDLAEFSKSMAPGDPKPYSVASQFWEKSFREEDQKAALSAAEKAVSYSPNDYSLWQTVARLRERSGDVSGAQAALEKALQLAPNYVSVKWALGNVLLRSNKTDEGFQMIRSAVEGDPKYAAPAAAIAWDIHAGDLKQVEKSIGKSSQVRAAIAVYLVKQEKFDDAVRFWQTVPPNERKQKYKTEANQIFAALTAKKQYRNAVRVATDLYDEEDAKAEFGRITNGGFEQNIRLEKARILDWTIEAGQTPSIGVSTEQKASGQKSLAVLFDGNPLRTFRSVSQIIAVNGSESYTFSLKYKSDLVSDATVIWQIRDSVTNDVLGTVGPIEAESDWTSLSVDFTVPEESEGVVLRLLRAKCAEQSCPISGTVWFDDLEVK